MGLARSRSRLERFGTAHDFHELAAIGAISRLTGKNVRDIDEARALAKKMNVDLKGA